MNYLTSESFNKILKKWSEVDPIVKNYGYGQLYNLNGEPRVKQVYPSIWVNPVSVNALENVIRRSYQIIIFDLYFENEEGDNSSKVISDCEESAYRLLRFLRKADDVFYLNESVDIQPFADRFKDAVVGVIINFNLDFNAVLSDCNDPDYIFDILKIKID